MKKLLLSVTVMLLITVQAMSQSVMFSGVNRFRSNNFGEILENNKVAGYYSFYLSDKVDRHNNQYSVTLMDENLNKVKEFSIVQDKDARLIEMTFNGNAFAMLFLIKSDLEMVLYDRDGKLRGKHVEEDISKWEKYRLAMAMTEDDEVNPSVFPSGPNAFIKQSFLKNEKLGYQIEAFGPDAKSLWKFGSDEKSEMIETAEVVFSAEKYIGLNVARKKGMMTKSYDGFFIMLDATTGKKIYEYPLRDKGSELSLINSYIDENSGKVYIVGDYYPEGSEIMKSKSVGLFVNVLDSKGVQDKFVKYSWAGDVKKFRQMDEDTKDKNMIFFHKVFRTQDGHIVLVGEQFKKQASALGIASRAMGGGGSTAEIRIKDMVTIVLDPDLKLENFQLIDKADNTAYLPQGYGALSSTMLAQIIKTYGWFDYSFSTSDVAKDEYTSVYVDLNHKDSDGKRADLMLGSITYKGGKVNTNKIPLNSDASRISVFPGKAGYFLMFEYFRKKKQMTVHLEKINI